MTNTIVAKAQGALRIPMQIAPYSIDTGSVNPVTLNSYGDFPVIMENTQIEVSAGGVYSPYAQLTNLAGKRLNTLGYDSISVKGSPSIANYNSPSAILLQGSWAIYGAVYAAYGNGGLPEEDSWAAYGKLYWPFGNTQINGNVGLNLSDPAAPLANSVPYRFIHNQLGIAYWSYPLSANIGYTFNATLGGIRGICTIGRRAAQFTLHTFCPQPGFDYMYPAQNYYATLPSELVQDFYSPFNTIDYANNQNYLWLPDSAYDTLSVYKWSIGQFNTLTGWGGLVTDTALSLFQFDDPALNAILNAGSYAQRIRQCAGRGWLFLTDNADYYINASGTKYWKIEYVSAAKTPAIPYGIELGAVVKGIDNQGIFWYVGPATQNGTVITPINSYAFNINYHPTIYPYNLSPVSLKCFNPCAEFLQGI